MQIDILTLFPEMLEGYLNLSIIKRAREAGLLQIGLHNIRDYTTDKHRITDEPPFGGGGGMILKPGPIFRAVDGILAGRERTPPVILMTPQGRPFTHEVARE